MTLCAVCLATVTDCHCAIVSPAHNRHLVLAVWLCTVSHSRTVSHSHSTVTHTHIIRCLVHWFSRRGPRRNTGECHPRNAGRSSQTESKARPNKSTGRRVTVGQSKTRWRVWRCPLHLIPFPNRKATKPTSPTHCPCRCQMHGKLEAARALDLARTKQA